MSLIDLTYFQGEINIGQIESTSVKLKINSFINKYEAVYLKKVFPDSFDTTTLSSNDNIKLAIAYFVYFHYTRNDLFQRAGIGETLPQSENSTVVSPQYRSIYAWNDMVNYTTEGLEAITSVEIDNPFECLNRFDI